MVISLGLCMADPSGDKDLQDMSESQELPLRFLFYRSYSVGQTGASDESCLRLVGNTCIH